jgi:heme-degrading monooxygenase HmoA
MLVNIVTFPTIKAGKNKEFIKWFRWSNEQYAKHKGFIRRRLLKPKEGGPYLALVEHESYKTFMAMHSSPTHAEVHKRVEPLFEGQPAPTFYETVVD